jgi:hypothetical protein
VTATTAVATAKSSATHSASDTTTPEADIAT